MASTNVPSSEEVKKVRIQCRTPDDGLFDFDIEKSRFEELLTTLVDCKYKLDGCITNDYVKDIKEHEGRCQYRTILCPVQPNEETCKDILAKNLVEHVTGHHNSDCLSTEENSFSVPIDIEDGKHLSKMVTIRDDILLFHLKSEDRKLRASLLFLKNTNNQMNCEVTLMADDVKWKNHNVQIPNSDFDFNEDNEQSAVFDLEKLTQVRNVFSSITVRVECNVALRENIAKNAQLVENIMCVVCKDFLSREFYLCELNKHMYCEPCYAFAGLCSFRLLGAKEPSVSKRCKSCCSPIISYSNKFTTPMELLKEYEYPCQNQSLGCKQYICSFTSKHELLCPFKVFKCAFNECAFAGKYLEFISHLQENHTSNIVNTNILKKPNKSWGGYMFAFGSVFLCKINERETCTIEWISTSVLKHNFSFEVTFDDKGSNKGVTFRNSSDESPDSNFGCQRKAYKVNCYKSIYNRIKKTSSFIIYREENISVGEVTFKILKK